MDSNITQDFWLPSEFLTDDDLLLDFKTDDLSSPVASVTGSTENESDEDDFITELTRKIAHSTLHDSDYDYVPKDCKLSGSPQSTLCGFKQGGRINPNLPPDVGLDLAEEVAKIRLIEEATAHPPRSGCGSGFYPSQARIAYLQLQASQFELMRHHEEMMRSRIYQLSNGRAVSTAAWPTLQQAQAQAQAQRQQPDSGTRPAFLGGKKERTGTGVFLPRRVGFNASEAKKKSERVVKSVIANSKTHLKSNGNSSSPMNPELRLPLEWTY